MKFTKNTNPVSSRDVVSSVGTKDTLSFYVTGDSWGDVRLNVTNGTSGTYIRLPAHSMRELAKELMHAADRAEEAAQKVAA